MSTSRQFGVTFWIFILLVSLTGCPNPGGGSVALTGEIDGHARFTGQTNHGGIIISADSVDSSGKTMAIKQAIATHGVASRMLAAQVTTDASGTYALTGLSAGTYTIYASSQSSLEKAVTTGVTVVAGKTVTAADMNLTPTGSIQGQVTINGASTGTLGIMVYIAGTSYSAMTDTAGAFTMSSVPAATGYTLIASLQGYNSATTSVDVAAGTTPSVVAMNLTTIVPSPTTGTVSGTATLNGATTGNTGIFVYLTGTSYITMTTNSSGVFTITGVAPGTYTLVASMVGYTPASPAGSVLVTAGGTINVGTLNLPTKVSTGTVSGTVSLDSSQGGVAGPGAGVSVSLAGTSYAGTTNSSGAFTLTGIAPASYTLVASKDGYTPSSVNAVNVAAGTTTTVPAIYLSPSVSVLTLAGGAGIYGAVDGIGSVARYNAPSGVTAIPSMFGFMTYVADTGNNTIRSVSGTTVTIAGLAGASGSTDATGTLARFNAPTGITTDGTNLYVTDYNNNTIRKIVVATGAVSTLAGLAGTSGSLDAMGSLARFNGPRGITSDTTNLYVTDYKNNTIRKIVIATGAVSTVAGLAGTSGSLDATGSLARFNGPRGITTDTTNLYVTDYNNNTIRKIVIATGVVTTLAGSVGNSGSTDGIGSLARFNGPAGISGVSLLYETDVSSNTIRMIDPYTGTVTTLAGTPGVWGCADGVGSAALFDYPDGIVYISYPYNNTLLAVADTGNGTIRIIQGKSF